MTRFVSVLGESAPYSFGDAVLAGWASDGGMLWPETIPRVSAATLHAWRALSYPALAAAILKLFISADDADFTHAEVDALCAGAFGRFGSADVVELSTPLPTSVTGDRSVRVAELWHGPTLAFKDLGMAILGRVLSHLLRRRGRRLTLLVGTSGDTGSSAIEAVRGLPNLSIFVLYPLQGYASITPVQERQMTAVAEIESNVHVYGVEGSSDDLDVPMEACFADKQFKARHSLGSVNSVNVVRLIVQTVHYFYAYLRAAPPGATAAVEFAVPCGAAGHLSAGLLALEMGLPARLVAATNSNDALHRLLSSGELRPGAAVRRTVSPSMDIQVPYNCWRLLYAAAGADARAVRRWQADFRSGRLALPESVRGWLAARVRSAPVDDDETLRTMRLVHAAGGPLLDPHTAVGVAAALRERSASGTTVCMGCAHPVKFTPAVARALGVDDAAALRAVLTPAAAAHRCVAPVAAMARAARTGYPPGEHTPPGCEGVLRRGGDWERDLKAWIERWSAAKSRL